MIRLYSDDSKDKGYKYNIRNDRLYLIEHKRRLNKTIYMEGREWNYYCMHSQTFDLVHGYEKSKTLGTFYWYWNDFRVFELTEDELESMLIMEELVG